MSEEGKAEGKAWVSESHDSRAIKIASEGAGALPASTVPHVFKNTIDKVGDKPALLFQPNGAEGSWSHWSWKEYYEQSRSFAKSLMSLGFAPHRAVNILGFNSKEWFCANQGTIMAGGIAAGIYASNLPDACHYISEHSEAEVVVVDGAEQLVKYKDISKRLPHLKALVVYGDPVPEGAQAAVPIYSFEDFQNLGKDVSDAALDERISAQRPEECCSLIYTSGTTGPPKAVMISHDNITWTTTVLLGMFPFDSTERCVSYLPLSHIAAQVLDMHGPMSLGCSVYFAQPDALRGSLVVTLKAVRPTMFFGVPRVWEKIYEKMSEVGKSTKGAKKSIATWAKRKGTERSQLMQYGAKGGYPSWFWLANMAVFSKVKASLGLDATKCCFTAAAPISREVLEYFASLNIPIYEVFGQSECTGPHTVNTPSAWKVGTVGRPMLGTESKIDPESGELCYRGRHIFMGYLKGPEASAETIDEEGWLHSGDVVTSDADENPHIVGISGFFSITGRIKELIITAGGENVPPVLIEEAFKKELPYISNCMVIGDQRKFLSIVIALKVEIDVTTGVASNKLTGSSLDHSESIGSSARTAPEAGACPKWKAILDAGMKKVNERSTSRAQVVQKWCIIPSDFTEAGGELTPTLKLKRKPTAVKYADLIDAMYK